MAQILVVAFSGQGNALLNLLRSAGHHVIGAITAPEAIELLAHHSPDLLISELRLGAFNGLSLVIRHQSSHPNMGAIILDRLYDPVLAGDARHYGAVYLVEPISESQLLAQVARKLTKLNPQRRWPRKRPTSRLVAQVAEQAALVMDVSYGGLRLETPRAGELPARFLISFPGSGVSIQARPVWVHPAPSGSWWCGAEVSDASRKAHQKWRQLVDSVATVL